jgi:hypothetical protein
LPYWAELHAEKREHILGCESRQFFNCALIELFNEHRSGCLTDAAAIPVKIEFPKGSVAIDQEAHLDAITTQGVCVFMEVRVSFATAAMVRRLVVF